MNKIMSHQVNREPYLACGLRGAALGGHEELYSKLLSQSTRRPHFRYEERLCSAFRVNNVSLVHQLLEFIGNTNDTFYKACKYGYAELVDILIAKFGINRQSGIRGACKGKHTNLIKLMLQGDDIPLGVINEGLIGACSGGDLFIVDWMISLGATNWKYAICAAAKGDHINVMKLLIEKWKQSTTQEETVDHESCHLMFLSSLMTACERYNEEMIHLICDSNYSCYDLMEDGIKYSCEHNIKSLKYLLSIYNTKLMDLDRIFGLVCGKNKQAMILLINAGASECFNCSKTIYEHIDQPYTQPDRPATILSSEYPPDPDFELW
jgi:hypothetical protein